MKSAKLYRQRAPESHRFRDCGTLRAVNAYLTAAAGVLLLAMTGAAAQPLRVEVRAERLIEAVDARGGREPALVPVTAVTPGDEVIYTVRFTNTAAALLEHATVTVAIPAGMRYVAGSAAGPGTDIGYSIDGGTVFAPAETLFFAGGQGRQRRVAPEFYTDIRWVMRKPLQPGATGFARFRAVAAAPSAGKKLATLSR
jgi:uncharacterized repeat protein (TIGR01451 family)